MARSVQDPDHEALHILVTLFVWAFIQDERHRNGIAARAR
jgi:hypothetical protein